MFGDVNMSLAQMNLVDWKATKRFFALHRNLDTLIRFYYTAKELIVERKIVRLRQARIVQLIFVLFSLHLISLSLKPSNDLYGILIRFDFYALFGMRPMFKPLSLLTTTMMVNMLYGLYFKTCHLKATKEFIKLILVPRRSRLVAQREKIVQVLLKSLNFFQLFIYSLIVWDLLTGYMFLSRLWPYLGSSLANDLGGLLTFALHYTLTVLTLSFFVYSAQLGVSTAMAVNLIMFEHFALADKILDNKQNTRLGALRSFIARHTQLLATVLELNTFYAHQMLMLTLISVPIHCAVVAALLLDEVNSIVRVMYFHFVLGLPICFVGIHWMTALYTQCIHRPYKRVLRLYIQLRTCSAPTLWRISSRVEAFITRKPYGITYGSLGLISMGAFARFMLLYGKLLLIAYKNLKKSREL